MYKYERTRFPSKMKFKVAILIQDNEASLHV